MDKFCSLLEGYAVTPAYENRQEDLDAYDTRFLTFPPHLHAGLELFYVRGGTIRVTCAGRQANLCAGSLAVIFPNVIHSYLSREEDEDGHFLLAICHPRLTGEALQTLNRYVPKDPFLTPDNVHPHVVYALEGLLEQYRGAPQAAVCAALTQLALAHALPRLELVKNAAPPDDLTARVVSLVAQRMNQPLTLEAVAREMGVSSYYLSRFFTQKLGMGFPDYLGRLRVRQAQNLLRSTQKKMQQVAFACGFESQRTFNRVFLRHCGMTPRQYREGGTAQEYARE
ncbi:MAG: AraC family transcriptional regulator [Eubacteriales bacterium]|nr:AraC family transcriptional regulator [Eubacteriales bacterium]